MTKCSGCGRRLDAPEHLGLSEDQCWSAAKAAAETLVARRAGHAAAAPATVDPFAELLASVKRRADELAASPHACARCGAKLLRQQDPCLACQTAAEESGRRSEEARERVTRAKIPAYFGNVSFDTIERGDWIVQDRRAVEAARAVAVPSIRWVTLIGNAGAGKSSLGVAIVRRLLDLGRRCLFVAADELGQARPHFDQRPRIVVDALAADVLLLDDMGAEPVGSNDYAGLVVRDRRQRGKPMIITTGLTEAQVEQKYGSSGMRRRLYWELDGGGAIEVRAASKQQPMRPTLRAVQGQGRGQTS